MFLAAFESTVAASTQSAIGTEFRATDNIAWLATSYLIVFVAIQPVSFLRVDLNSPYSILALWSRVGAVREDQGVSVQLDLLRYRVSGMRTKPKPRRDDRSKGDLWPGRCVLGTTAVFMIVS